MHALRIKDEMPPLAVPSERDAAGGDGDGDQSDTSMTTGTDKTSCKSSRRRNLKHREKKAQRTMQKVRAKKQELGLVFTPWTSRRALNNVLRMHCRGIRLH